MTTERQLTPNELALRDAAYDYHRVGSAGKISIQPTKPLVNQRDLSLAYSPGVAYPCLAIQKDPAQAAEFTSRANLVGVVTNGTAVLGLGDIGPLAGKPVMEGKGCLFKKFADIDVFDIELAERDPDKLVEIIAALEPTLGGVNLEDIKSPECFYIEKKLRERMNIPVFHDDQHGTAIISSAALLNGLELVGKDIKTVKVAVSGAGAAALACLAMIEELGVQTQNISVCDSKGLIYQGREGIGTEKARYAQADDGRRTLADAVRDADVFLGCSTANILTPEMVQSMADKPVILALANPVPEILPEVAKAARPDCIIATGRSDYPNQVNNVLCFPYIFRGALDCGATRITESMKLACVREIAALAKLEVSDEVSEAYKGQDLRFGPDYIIPTPFDTRLILHIAPAVAKAAAEAGVATRPIADLHAYREKLNGMITHTGLFMRPVFQAAKAASAKAKRVVYSEGEDPRVLRAAQMALHEGIATPLLVGNTDVIQEQIEQLGLHIRVGQDVGVLDPQNLPSYQGYWNKYHELMGREGVSPAAAQNAVRHNHTIIAALAVLLGDADAMVTGMRDSFDKNLQVVRNVIGLDKARASNFAALNAVILEKHTLFIADTYVNEDPSAQELAEIALMASKEMQRFGITPQVAFLSHSDFGSSKRASALKMRQAHEIFRQLAPEIASEGELQGDSAINAVLRNERLSNNRLEGSANLLICPNLDAANILFNVLKVTGGNGLTIGPTLLGAAASAHILTPAASMRRILNQTALAVADAENRRRSARA